MRRAVSSRKYLNPCKLSDLSYDQRIGRKKEPSCRWKRKGCALSYMARRKASLSLDRLKTIVRDFGFRAFVFRTRSDFSIPSLDFRTRTNGRKCWVRQEVGADGIHPKTTVYVMQAPIFPSYTGYPAAGPALRCRQGRLSRSEFTLRTRRQIRHNKPALFRNMTVRQHASSTKHLA